MTDINLEKQDNTCHKDVRIKSLENNLGWLVVVIWGCAMVIIAMSAAWWSSLESADYWKAATSRALNTPKPTARIGELERQLINVEFDKQKLKYEARLWEVAHQQCESKFDVIKGMIK